MELGALDTMLSNIDPTVIYVGVAILVVLAIVAIIKKAIQLAIVVLVICVVMSLSGYRAGQLRELIPGLADKIPTESDVGRVLDEVDTDKIKDAGGKVFEFFSDLGDK